VTDERALLMAVPLRHLECAAEPPDGQVTLPAGGLGDLATTSPGTLVIVMATDAADADVPAATWRATFVRHLTYDLGAPWPAGLPPTWIEEHGDPPPAAPLHSERDAVPGDEDDPYDDDADDADGPDLVQSFLEVTGLERLPRDEWLFANELVGKQARRGRSFLPRVPTMVSLPD
jgi:hypothetical protein